MFGSNPFGQSSSSPFGSPSMFGQTSSATTNPFAPKPFGSPTSSPFATQTGSSIFGSTSTGVFGQTPSPLSTTPAFGASSTPAFGNSTPSFGASSTSAFGGGSSSFGGSSLFGQKPAFGGFGSTSSQSSPFGSTFQQTQPAFGSTPFGSTTPFGASHPAFGSTSTPAFGSTSTPAFGSTTTPVFGATSTPAFGATSTPAFGSTTAPAFGSTGSAFGVSSTPAFGASSLFGSSSTPAFGQSSTPTFGQSSTPAFGQSSAPTFGFGSTPAFGQSSSAFGSTFGAPSFGSQSSPFGGQTATPTFGSPGFGQATFGGQRGGSRAVAYSPTVDTDGATGTQPAGKLESISAMPAYKEKSHEELRWEDYQQGDKGGPNPAGQPGTGAGFSASAQTNLFGSTSTVQTNPFGQASASTFSSSGGLFGQKTPSFSTPSFGSSSAPSFSSPFGSTSSSPFGSTSTTAPLFSSSTVSAFGGSTTPSIFGNSATSAFGTSTPFGSSAVLGSTPAFGSGLNFGNTQSAGLFQSSPATLQAPSIFGQPTTGFGQTTSTFGSNLFNTQASAFGGSLFGSSSSAASSGASLGFGQSTPSFSSPFQTTTQNLSPGNFSFGNIGQTQTAPSSGFGSTSSMLGQATFGQSGAIQTSVVVQPAPITNPFGSLPAMPQMSIGQAGLASPIQYGISSMPVSEKPTPVRNSSLLTPRHLSQRRIKLPARKYHPKIDGPRVPFFCNEEEAPSTPKADALFIPRENPRSLIIRPIEQWPGKSDMVRKSLPRTDSNPIHENGHSSDRNGHGVDQTGRSPSKSSQKLNGIHEEQTENGVESSYMTISGHRAGKAAIVYEHGADIEALMPKLRHPEYYTEPRIQELAAKERAEPGFCRHVRDFVVGRHGYGNIKFDDETDVRRLDLESIVQFNHREVVVYKDESKKPPVGQGLNKPAQVTLLNVKCVDKKTGRQFNDGPKIEKYKELLKRKTTEQGAEFISYDPVKGEWKFKVEHFSHYEFEDEDLCDAEEYLGHKMVVELRK